MICFGITHHFYSFLFFRSQDLPSNHLGCTFGCPDVDLIELPRLKLAFNLRPDHEGVLRLYSVDHVDLYISNERNNGTQAMLAGIPHSLLLTNIKGESQVRSLFSRVVLYA